MKSHLPIKLLRFSGFAIFLLSLAGVARAAPLCANNTPGSATWCEGTFTITSAATVQGTTQGSPRQFLQLQNNSAAATNIIGICFGAAARGVSCSAATAGQYLGQGQSFSRSNQNLYGGLIINSLYFNSDVSAVCLTGTCALSVSIDG